MDAPPRLISIGKEEGSKLIRAALYIVRQGAYREPRLAEVQYERISRYLGCLQEMYGIHVSREQLFVDIAAQKGVHFETDVPAFTRMIEQINAKRIDAVVLDLQVGLPFSPGEFMPLLNTLERTGVRVFNAFYGNENPVRAQIVRDFGESALHCVHSDDDEEFITWFPGRAAGIAVALLRQLGSQVPPELIGKILQYGTQTSGHFSLLSAADWERINIYKQKQRQERRQHEDIWVNGPDDEGHLVDESINRQRTDVELKFALDRLGTLGFTQHREGQRVSFRREREGQVVYADHREAGRLNFYVYNNLPIPETAAPRARRRRPIPRLTKYLPDFYILDSWKNNVAGKWDDRFRATVSKAGNSLA